MNSRLGSVFLLAVFSALMWTGVGVAAEQYREAPADARAGTQPQPFGRDAFIAEPIFDFIAEPLFAEPVVVDKREGWYRDEQGRVVIPREGGSSYVLPRGCVGLGGDPDPQWLDQGHFAISRGLCWPVRWIDRQFGDVDEEYGYGAGAYLSVEYQHEWRALRDSDEKLSLSTSVSLPYLEDRLSLFFSSRDDQPRGGEADPVNQIEEEEEDFQAGLRWVLEATDAVNLDTDVGVRSGIRPFVRTRYRQRWSPAEKWFVRVTQSVRLVEETGVDTETVLDIDRETSGGDAVIRATSRLEWSDENVADGIGWFWRQSLGYAVRIDNRTAVNMGAQVQGHTRPNTRAEDYLVSWRFRRSIWRPWFFYEVEPFFNWTRETDFTRDNGLWLRSEIRFGLYEE